MGKKMAKIVRTPSKVTGGITADEKRRMNEHAQLWISRAMRTTPIDPDKIVPAIKGIYAAAGLKEAWRESPEGIAAAERSNADRAEKQALHGALMDRLATLDWSDQVAVLDWLCAMQPATDRIGVIIRKDTIAAAFVERGYTPGMDVGREYQAGVKNSEYRYLIGQALDGIVNGPAIHPILHKFVAEWKARWAPKEHGMTAPKFGSED